jgi:hypothetical protein
MGLVMANNGCHVCGKAFVGVWKDQEGWTLKACGEPECVQGYTQVLTAEQFYRLKGKTKGEVA